MIVSVGFLQNLAGLLQSPGDELSPSSGYELVRDKVGGTLEPGQVLPPLQLSSCQD